MAIEVTQFHSTPALDYKHVFLDQLRIEQITAATQSDLPLYNVHIAYRMFAVGEDGVRHYTSAPERITITNYLQAAAVKLQAGDPDLMVALQSIEKALAVIIEDQSKVGHTIVT